MRAFRFITSRLNLNTKLVLFKENQPKKNRGSERAKEMIACRLLNLTWTRFPSSIDAVSFDLRPFVCVCVCVCVYVFFFSFIFFFLFLFFFACERSLAHTMQRSKALTVSNDADWRGYRNGRTERGWGSTGGGPGGVYMSLTSGPAPVLSTY